MIFQKIYLLRYTLVIKWLGTILCLCGIFLTSFNIYPLNIVLSIIGSTLWTAAGIIQRDIPLFIVEAVAVAFYLAGLINYTRIV
jgi:hypothetical protein